MVLFMVSCFNNNTTTKNDFINNGPVGRPGLVVANGEVVSFIFVNYIICILESKY